MPRKLLQRSELLPYHVTARANNRETFPLPLDQLWEIIGFECLVLTIAYEVKIHALVLMPNHIHMLLTVPRHDLGLAMNVFLSSVTRSSNMLSGRSGHLFGGPYYGSLISGTHYFGHALKYVYRNPVKAKLCELVEEFPYSTLHGLLGHSHLPFPIHFTRVGMEINLPSGEPHQQLEWLNQPFPNEAERLIKKGLRKRIFETMLDRKSRKPIELLNELI